MMLAHAMKRSCAVHGYPLVSSFLLAELHPIRVCGRVVRILSPVWRLLTGHDAREVRLLSSPTPHNRSG
jgi:hypothetical protein